MIYIEKREEIVPKWLKQLKKSNITYDKLQASQKRTLREILLKEQYYICAYCCCTIDQETAMNEHIVPQRLGQAQLEYKNIVASCKRGESKASEKTCGSRKGGADIDFVSPLDEDCETHFAYLMNGKIIGNNDRAKATIDLLGLNTYALCQARKAVFDGTYYENESLLACDDVEKCFLKPDEDGKLQRYCNIIKYFFYQEHIYGDIK